MNTKWSLFPMGDLDENYVVFYLNREIDSSGPDVIEICHQLAFLDKDGSILKERTVSKSKFQKHYHWRFSEVEKRERVFITERETFVPEDTLTIQCTIWITDEKPDKSNHLFASTLIKVRRRRSFLWKIEKLSSLKSSIKNKFQDNLIDLDLVLSEGFDRLNIDMTSFNEAITYISCNTSVIDFEGRKKNYGSKKYFSRDLKKGVLSFMLLFPKMLMENKSQYFPNDVLSLDFEFVLATVESFGRLKVDKKVKSEEKLVLTDALESMYSDGIFSDMELRTSTKTFPVNKCILSARSPVFRNMFSLDMKEKNSGHVDIFDLENDTIHRMLLYIYTDSLKDLQFETASKLYAAADKYQILCLKSRCSSFLKGNLSSTNACDALVLADLHNDGDLKSAVEDFILQQNNIIFYSKEWINFMSTHPKLALDLLYGKITNCKKITLPKKRKSEVKL